MITKVTKKIQGSKVGRIHENSDSELKARSQQMSGRNHCKAGHPEGQARDVRPVAREWMRLGLHTDISIQEKPADKKQQKHSQVTVWKTIDQIVHLYGSKTVAESIVKEKKTGAPYHPVENPIGTWRNHPETECE